MCILSSGVHAVELQFISQSLCLSVGLCRGFNSHLGQLFLLSWVSLCCFALRSIFDTCAYPDTHVQVSVAKMITLLHISLF